MIGSSSRTPSIAFDPEQDDTPAERAALLADFRNRCPVARSNSHNGFWLVSRYEDCVEILGDSDGFSTAKHVDPVTGEIKGGNAIPGVAWGRVIPAETESPEWERYRGALNPFFTPKMVEKRRDDAAAFAHQLLNDATAGPVDFVLDLGNPLSAVGIMQLLGLPTCEWKRWAEPFHTTVHSRVGSPEHQAAVAGIEWVCEQIRLEIARRRENSAPGLLSELMELPLDGTPLTDAEIFDLAMQVLSGAVETTTSLTANALYFLHQNHDARAALIRDRSMIRKSFDEFLRFFTPVQGLARTVKSARTIGGVNMEEGDRLLMSYASANRDEAAFESPNELVLDRLPNRHLALGRGQHFCLGSFQARMMFEVMLNAVFDRMPDYEIIETEAERYPSLGLINGWVCMPARHGRL